jgi:hypothetical protein
LIVWLVFNGLYILFLGYNEQNHGYNEQMISFWAHDKIYTGVRREPDGGKLSSAVNGPDICRQQARRLPSTGPTKSTPAYIGSLTVANCHLPSKGPMSAVNAPDKPNSNKLHNVCH